MEELEYDTYFPEKVFRMFSLFKQILGHARVISLPLPITFIYETIKAIRDIYKSIANSIYAIFNSGKSSMKAIGGALVMGPMALLLLFAQVGNQSIEIFHHFSMIVMISFTFGCFNEYFGSSKYMILVQIVTIGTFLMLFFLRKKKILRLFLDFMISFSVFGYINHLSYTEALIAFIVGVAGIVTIIFYVFFRFFSCCFKKFCCCKFKSPEHTDAISILQYNNDNMLDLNDVCDLRTQQTHYFLWTIAHCTIFALTMVSLSALFYNLSRKTPATISKHIIEIALGSCDCLIFLIIYIPHFSDQWCTDDPSMKRAKRRGMITRYSLKLIYLILDFMAVPLTKCIVETLYDSTIQKAALGQYVLLGFFAQIIGFPAIYIVTMMETHNILKTVYNPSTDMSEEMKWMKYCEHIDSSTVANFEIYKYKFRYWFFVKYAVDLVDGVLSVAYIHNPKVFYGSFVLHILFLVANCIFRPSFYWVHNIVAITSGISSILEDINIILDINQKENWTEKTPFIIALFIIPAVAAIISIVSFLIEKCVRKNMTKLDLEEKNHYRCIGFILDDRAFDIFSWWSLHMMAIGVGVLMVSMTVSIGMPNDKIWMGFGIFETILFCAGWIFSMKKTTLNISDI